LIVFLNELFKGQKHIVGLTYNNTEHQEPQAKYRSLRYDLVCTNRDGAHFIIEMQRVRQKYFRDRVENFPGNF
jgi:hypothetical protein